MAIWDWFKRKPSEYELNAMEQRLRGRVDSERKSLNSISRNSTRIHAVGVDKKKHRRTVDDGDLVNLVYSDSDFLGKAALAGHKGIAAKKMKNYDEAWRFFNEQKGYYMQHAGRSGFSNESTVGLDASVSKQLADIQRLEGKHHNALVHILYWVSCAETMTKEQNNKLRAYFNRAKFKGVDNLELLQLIASQYPLPDYEVLQETVAEWKSRSM
jgi:hypothetical protein